MSPARTGPCGPLARHCGRTLECFLLTGQSVPAQRIIFTTKRKNARNFGPPHQPPWLALGTRIETFTSRRTTLTPTTGDRTLFLSLCVFGPLCTLHTALFGCGCLDVFFFASLPSSPLRFRSFSRVLNVSVFGLNLPEYTCAPFCALDRTPTTSERTRNALCLPPLPACPILLHFSFPFSPTPPPPPPAEGRGHGRAREENKNCC